MKNRRLLRNRSARGHIEEVLERTPFPEAMRKVMEVLNSEEHGFTISSLASKTKLHRRTVEKVVDLLTTVQKCFESSRLEVEKLNRMKVLRLNKRVGLLNLPEHTQRLILKTAYFPEPTEEQRIIAHLFLRGAVTQEKPVSLEKTPTLKKLVKQGQVIEQGGKFYLSEEGIMVARGTIDLYPELQKVIPKP